MLRLDDVQADEGVVAVQGGQQQVHPLQCGSDAEGARQLPQGGLREETPTLEPGDQEAGTVVLQHAVQPLGRRVLSSTSKHTQVKAFHM